MVTGGLSDTANQAWLKIVNKFCLLKLHGSIAYPEGDSFNFHTLFKAHPYERSMHLFNISHDGTLPPVLFPWEVPCLEPAGNAPKSQLLDETLNHLFTGVWKRAALAIEQATKISFVGLSMHEYLMDGLRFLFKEKKAGEVEIVVANPACTRFVQGQKLTHWSRQLQGPAYGVAKMLREVAPNLKKVGRFDGVNRTDGELTIVPDFSTFIREELGPA